MIYFLWALMALASAPLTLVAIILSPVLPLLAKDKAGPIANGTGWGNGPRLPDWLSWFQTWDNSLYGDETFQQINGTSYWSMVKWQIRNPLPSFGMFLIGPTETEVTGDNRIHDGQSGVAGWVLVKAGGLFQFVWIKQVSETRCFYLNIGWNLRGLVNNPVLLYRATFSFSPRFSSF